MRRYNAVCEDVGGPQAPYPLLVGRAPALCTHRRKYLTLISNACLLLRPERKLLLRQRFFSSAVAACNQEVVYRVYPQTLISLAVQYDENPRATFWHRAALESNSTQLGINVTKDELRAELERQEQRYKDVYGGEVTTYAAQPEPERKPWRKRASLLDQAFAQEIQKIEQDLKTEEP